MNNKKQIIQFVIIACAFLGAGFVLYKGGLFGGSSQGPALNSLVLGQTGSSDPSQKILPYGDKLNFSALNQSRFNYNQFEFQPVDPSSDVGVDVSQLIIPENKNPNDSLKPGSSAPLK